MSSESWRINIGFDEPFKFDIIVNISVIVAADLMNNGTFTGNFSNLSISILASKWGVNSSIDGTSLTQSGSYCLAKHATKHFKIITTKQLGNLTSNMGDRYMVPINWYVDWFRLETLMY